MFTIGKGECVDADDSALTFEQLRALLRVAEGGGYAAAGGGSKQAGYQKLKRLQAALLGHERAPRIVAAGGWDLAPAGHRLLGDVLEVVKALDKLHARAAEVAGSERVEVACLPAHLPVIEEAWGRWASRQDRREVILRDVSDRHRADLGRELVALARTGAVDVAVAPDGTEGGEAVTTTPMYRWPVRVVTDEGHPLSDRSSIELSELQDLADDLLASPPGYFSRGLLLSAGVPLSFAFESASVDALVELATRGRGVALVAGDAIPVQNVLHSRSLPVVLARGTVLSGGCSIIRASQDDRAHVEEFVEDMVAIARMRFPDPATLA